MGTKPYRLLALIACLAIPAVANGYYLEMRGEVTEPVRWADDNVEFRLNTSTFPAGDGVADAVRASFTTWTDEACAAIAFTEGTESASVQNDHWTLDDGDRYILVYFTDSNEEWTNGPAVGHFFFGFDAPTGEIIGATIVLNSRDHSWATDGSAGALDVQSVVTALIGRSLGITSAMEGNATYPVYMPGNTDKRVLGSDDIAAIQQLYLVDGCAAPAPPEMVCDGLNLPGEEVCPPPVMTNPGDGGTVIPGEDAGTTDDPDAGIGDDAGMVGTDDGGCGCRAAGTRGHGGIAIVIAIAALLWNARRRR